MLQVRKNTKSCMLRRTKVQYTSKTWTCIIKTDLNEARDSFPRFVLRPISESQSRRGKRKEDDEFIESAEQCSSTNSQRTSTGLFAACPHRASGGSAAGAWPADCDLGQSDSRSPGCPRRR